MARLAGLFGTHAPDDGVFELRTPGVYAIRVSKHGDSQNDVACASRRVGCVSASPCSRESGRCLGAAPTRDLHPCGLATAEAST